MPAGPAPSAADEWRQNWGVVLAGALGIGLASLSIYSIGIFIAPLEQEFGWSRAEITSGLTIISVIGMAVAPFMGALVDRYGPRRLGVIGVVAYCGVFACFSLTTSSLWSWLGLWLMLAGAAALIKPTVWTTGVSSLFERGRGLALSFMLCGTALGSTLTPIVANWMIEALGWRKAFVGIAGFWAVLVIPAVFFLFTSAKDRLRLDGVELQEQKIVLPVQDGIAWRQALLSWKFARLAGAAVVTTLAVVSFVANIVPILTFTGIGRTESASVAGLVGISTIVGRLTAGYLLDRINGGIVGGVSLLLPIISCILLLMYPGSVPISSVAILILGLSLGAELDAVAYLTTRHFGLFNFGVIFGTIAGLLAMATGVGPFLVSLSYDMTQSYFPALTAYIPACLLASALFFSLGRYPNFSEAAS